MAPMERDGSGSRRALPLAAALLAGLLAAACGSGSTTRSAGSGGGSGNGATGASGRTGTAGTAGSAGTAGTAGTTGIAGAPGTAGTLGAAGTTGSAGTSGTTGTSGSAGTTGVAGTSGVAGITGTAGTTGTAGAAGTNGAAGTAGATGAGGAAGGAGAAAGSGGATAGNGGAAGSGGAAGGAGGQGGGCGNLTKVLQATVADILLVQDKSGSLNDDPNDLTCTGGCGANSKWALVTSAINQVVGATDATVDGGLKFFATTNTGCVVNAGVEVAVGPSNAAAIANAIAAAAPGSSTPTRLAEQAAVAYLESLTDTNPKYILLATDGLPNCMPGATNTNTDDSPGTIQAVGDALAAGFPTFVVGIGNTMGTTVLNEMAIAGGEPQMGAATLFYQVGDTASLVATLSLIVGTTVSCTYDLGSPPAGASNAAITVLGDGAPIPKDAAHANGWDYEATGGAITIYGPTCDAIKARTLKTVSVTYICN